MFIPHFWQPLLLQSWLSIYWDNLGETDKSIIFGPICLLCDQRCLDVIKTLEHYYFWDKINVTDTKLLDDLMVKFNFFFVSTHSTRFLDFLQAEFIPKCSLILGLSFCRGLHIPNSTEDLAKIILLV